MSFYAKLNAELEQMLIDSKELARNTKAFKEYNARFRAAPLGYLRGVSAKAH
jgi:hypothetical protein